MADRSGGVKVTGAKELRAAIKKAEDQDLGQELAKAYRGAANIVTERSRLNSPTQSGDLRNSIRSLGGKTRAIVAAGQGRTNDYAGVIHYGWPARKITPQPFIHEALKSEWDRVYDTFEEAIDAVTKKI